MAMLTRVNLAKKGTESLRTTIPEGIREFMELSEKDEIEWKMHIEENKRMAVVQKKVNNSSIERARFAPRRKKKSRE
jgi:bifunctional DNA-binding transcriptional regulator/antitoxin component of YhaV-PrlF toxin-antitoxin module